MATSSIFVSVPTSVSMHAFDAVSLPIQTFSVRYESVSTQTLLQN
jgi:hypothetical protein